MSSSRAVKSRKTESLIELASANTVTLATVTRIDDGQVFVTCDGTEQERVALLLEHLTAPQPDARVLVSMVDGEVVVLGSLTDRLPADEAEASRTRQDTVCLEADKRLELKCGPARIVLRRDGSIVIRGIRIFSRSATDHRIKGATVKIN